MSDTASDLNEVHEPVVTAADAVLEPVVETPPLPELRMPRSVRDILNEPVTAHMGVAAPLLQSTQTVAESLELIRSRQDIGQVVYFYVVDEERRLLGVVPTRKLLLSGLDTTISSIMSSRLVSIPSTATVLEACEFFTLHKFLAFPVIDADRKVVGAVDVSLYTDELLKIEHRQESDDLFQLIGVHLSEAAQGNARLAFFGRFPWLLCNVLGGMLAALIADAYQDVSTLVLVAPFIALVTALAESVSIQSVSLALQMLHAGPANWDRFLKKLRMELVVGTLLGGACGLTVGLVALLWKGDLLVAVSLALGILGGVVASAGIGLAMPFVLKLCRRDPQLASGPIALALSDVVTLLCYFNLGRWLLT
ncbi:magnesium transporter [Planctomicrobium piriforme]|uniref:Magnesium transporter n=1 Tax=Planctomicrobium piriforme TaxID=1576369 RepID=A0A1I3PC53_9PLAN|nr:magnesium transporter [Planctomicrobium piriforme]SFJ19194.1 magnesium transporter [Planctomicrobium piriforme]